MIITKKYAQKLIREGRAHTDGKTCDGIRWPEGRAYTIVVRTDLQRIDHYRD